MKKILVFDDKATAFILDPNSRMARTYSGRERTKCYTENTRKNKQPTVKEVERKWTTSYLIGVFYQFLLSFPNAIMFGLFIFHFSNFIIRCSHDIVYIIIFVQFRVFFFLSFHRRRIFLFCTSVAWWQWFLVRSAFVYFINLLIVCQSLSFFKCIFHLVFRSIFLLVALNDTIITSMFDVCIHTLSGRYISHFIILFLHLGSSYFRCFVHRFDFMFINMLLTINIYVAVVTRFYVFHSLWDE